jgi:pyruvate,water dikinase
MMSAAPISALEDLRAADADQFGGKSASLGELLAAGIPVPPGFALPAAAFTEFIARSGLVPAIAENLASVGDGVDGLHAAARRIAEAIQAADVPPQLVSAVAEHYAQLAGDDAPVAVRSSALGEDSAEATFAGQQETILWVRGADAVIEAIRACWASLYSAEAISYRRRLKGVEPAMGVTVQRMVDAAVSGVMFTCNPLSGDRSMVAINAAWGLGLAVVGGEVTPDDLLVSKVTGEVVRETIADKHVHFGSPQDVEWAFDADGEPFVLQSRPVTGLPARTTAPRPASAMALVMGTFGARPTEKS